MRINRLIPLLCIGLTLLLTGCSPEMRDVPPGYIGKILTTKGWQSGFFEASQVNIGVEDSEGGNKLIICEATTYNAKESFSKSVDKESGTQNNHQILTADKVPLDVDVYVQVALPEDEAARNTIYAEVTPTFFETDHRYAKITLEDIYSKYAKMIIRAKTRQIFYQYKDYNDVTSHYEEINKKVSGMIAATFKANKLPLVLIAGEISNIKADEVVSLAQNKNAAAAADIAVINKIGAAMKANPAYLQKYKWDCLKEVAGKGTTIIVNDGGTTGMNYSVK